MRPTVLLVFAFSTALVIAAATPAHADPITGLFVAIKGFISTTLAAGGIGAFLLRGALSIGASLLQAAFAPKPKVPGQRIGGVGTGEAFPRSFTLGRALAATSLAYHNSFGVFGKTPNANYVQVLAFADRPGEQLARIAFADKWATLGDTPHADGRGFPVLEYRVKGQDYCWVKFHDGTQTTADPFLLATFGDDPDYPLAASFVGHGVAHAIVTMTLVNREAFPNGKPDVRPEMIGAGVYDPRLDTTAGGAGPQRADDPSTWAPSENLAVLAGAAARGIPLPGGRTYGGGVNVPVANLAAAANVCDLPVGDDDRPQFRGGLQIALPEAEPASVIEALAEAGLGQIVNTGTGLNLHFGPPATALVTITDDDIALSEPLTEAAFPSLRSVVNAVSISHPDPERLWETVQTPEMQDEAALAADGGYRPAVLSLPACRDHQQAQHVGAGLLADNRRFLQFQVVLPPDLAVRLMPGSTLEWVSARYGFEGKLFEVVAREIDLGTLFGFVTLRERDPDDAAVPPGLQPLPAPPTPAPLAPRVIETWAAEGVAILDDADQPRRPDVAVTWDAGQAEDAARVEYELEHIASGTRVVAGLWAAEAGQGLTGGTLLPGTSYRARIRPALAARATDWTDWQTVTTPDVRLGAVDLDEDYLIEIEAVLDEAIAARDEALGAVVMAGTVLTETYAARDATEAYRDASQAAQTAAELARNQAQTQATNAAGSATAAAGSASTAGTHATNAGVSATAAAASVVTANAARDTAQDAATAAATSASAASASATAAGSSAAATEADRLAAQTARSGAEAARDTAVTASTTAQGAASTATTQAGLAVSASTAAQGAAATTFPSNFLADGAFFTASEHIGFNAPAVSAARFRDSSDGQRVYFRTGFELIGHRALMPVQAGRTYYVEARVRVTADSTVTGGTAEAAVLGLRLYDAAGVMLSTGGLTGGANIVNPLRIANGWVTLSGTYVAPVDTPASFLRGRLYVGFQSGGNGNATWEVSSYIVRDVSERTDAAASATASATSASAASASATNAGTYASAALADRLAAQTARSGSESARDTAITARDDAAGSASTATIQAGIATSASLATVMVEGNPGFDQGGTGWSSNSGGSGTLPAHYTVGPALGRGSVLGHTVDSPGSIYQHRVHWLAPGRLYQVRAIMAATGAAVTVYAGVSTVDADGAVIGANSGRWYNTANAANLTPAAGWTTYTSAPFGLTDIQALAGRGPDAVGIRLQGILSYLNANPAARSYLDGIWLEDVTESQAAASSATASATSATSAASSATAAGSSAVAAQNDRIAAQTARTGSEAARDLSVLAREGAEGAATSALASLTLTSRLAGQGAGVLYGQFLEAETGIGGFFGTAPTIAANTRYGTGRQMTWALAAATQGYGVINSDHAGWSGPKNCDAYVVEMEFVLNSGAVGGAGILMRWVNTAPSNFDASMHLADMVSGPIVVGQPMTARGVFRRPAGFTGTFLRNQAFLMAGWTGLNPIAAKNITIFRWHIRPAAAEDLGGGAVQAAVEQRHYTIAQSNQAIAGAMTAVTAATDPTDVSTGRMQLTAVAGPSGYAGFAVQVRAGGTGAFALAAFRLLAPTNPALPSLIEFTAERTVFQTPGGLVAPFAITGSEITVAVPIQSVNFANPAVPGFRVDPVTGTFTGNRFVGRDGLDINAASDSVDAYTTGITTYVPAAYGDTNALLITLPSNTRQQVWRVNVAGWLRYATAGDPIQAYAGYAEIRYRKKLGSGDAFAEWVVLPELISQATWTAWRSVDLAVDVAGLFHEAQVQVRFLRSRVSGSGGFINTEAAGTHRDFSLIAERRQR